MSEIPEYNPLRSRRTIRHSLERIGSIGLAIGLGALKYGLFFGKFFSFFISVAAFSFWFHSWSFAFGFVLLIAVHEFGHVIEARRQGLKVSMPTFIPFIGAYVTIEKAGLTPWRNAMISLAGPFVGGAASGALWVFGHARGSEMLLVLANLGFLLNAFNMLPIGFLDGGQAVHAAREAWRMPVIRFEGGIPVQAFAPERSRSLAIAGLYLGLAAALVVGMLATRINGAL
jgi:membrane-associated protease RseP (regulator of RpoE activity)